MNEWMLSTKSCQAHKQIFYMSQIKRQLEFLFKDENH